MWRAHPRAARRGLWFASRLWVHRFQMPARRNRSGYGRRRRRQFPDAWQAIRGPADLTGIRRAAVPELLAVAVESLLPARGERPSSHASPDLFADPVRFA